MARLDEMLAYQPYVAQADAVTQLHAMRIAAKKLRYTLEIFQDAYSRFTPHGKAYLEIIDTVKTLQEQLGDLHDADVLVPELTAQLLSMLAVGQERGRPAQMTPGVHQVDFDACLGLLMVCRDTRASRDRRYAEFVANWQRLQVEQRFLQWRELLEYDLPPKPPAIAAQKGDSYV
jgi:hypothetical protein